MNKIRNTRNFILRFMTGILIAILISVSVGMLAYNSLWSLVTTISDEAQPNRKLMLLKEIQFDLSDAENSVRTYTLTNDPAQLEHYYSSIHNVGEKLEVLRSLSIPHSLQQYRIDSIQVLVQHKVQVLDELIGLRDNEWQVRQLETLKKEFELDQSLNESEKEQPLADSRRPVSQAINPEEIADVHESALPAVQEKGEKRGFFGRLFGKKEKAQPLTEKVVEYAPVIHPVSPPTGVKNDTLNPSPQKKQEEKLVANLRQKLEHIRNNEARELELKKQKELELVSRDRQIISSIRSLINRMEEDENLASASNAELASDSARQTTNIIFSLSAITLLVLVVCAIVVFSYLIANNRYKRVLHEAKNHAEKSANAKKVFLAHMSHEIRTPINAILGFSEQLRQGELANSQREQLDIIHHSTNHLLSVINDILDYSKMESGKLNLESVGFNPQQLCRKVYDLFLRSASEKEIVLELLIDPSIPEVLIGDPVRLRQVLINLISNAVKFTEKGKVTLGAGGRKLDNGLWRLELYVQDTGIGIPSDKIERVFGSFEQADTSTSRKYGGSGLGLAISKQLVELQQGSLSLVSQPGSGSIFSVSLSYPIGAHADLPEEEKASPVVFKLSGGLRVLIADDEEYNLTLLQTILQKHPDVFIQLAHTGKEAIDALKKEDFDLVLMDVRMPEMSGIEAANYIRHKLKDHKSKVPIIALTAGISKEKIDRCKAAGMNDFLAKPFRERELLQKINQVLFRHKVPEKKPSSLPLTEQSYNLSELYELGNGDHDFVKQMIDIFIETSRESVAIMLASVSQGDYDPIPMQAHKLAAPCRHLGLYSIVEKLKILEEAPQRKLSPEETDTLVKAVNTELSLVTAELRKEVENLKIP